MIYSSAYSILQHLLSLYLFLIFKVRRSFLAARYCSIRYHSALSSISPLCCYVKTITSEKWRGNGNHISWNFILFQEKILRIYFRSFSLNIFFFWLRFWHSVLTRTDIFFSCYSATFFHVIIGPPLFLWKMYYSKSFWFGQKKLEWVCHVLPSIHNIC